MRYCPSRVGLELPHGSASISVRFRNEFATEAHPGALPQGQNAPQHAAAGPVHGTDQRHGLHRATPPEIAAPGVTASGLRSCMSRSRVCANHAAAQRAVQRGAHAAQSNAMESHLHAYGEDGFVEGIVHPGRQRRPGHAGWSGHSICNVANAPMHDRFFYNADGEMLHPAAAGAARAAHPNSARWRLAPGELAVNSARHQVPRRNFPTDRRAATSARTTACRSGCRSGAHRRQRPGQLARLPHADRSL